MLTTMIEYCLFTLNFLKDIKALWEMKRFMKINLPGATKVVRSMSKHD